MFYQSSSEKNLTNRAGSDEDPAWFPSGKKIAFEAFRNTDREIFSMNPDGTVQRNLTHNDANDVTPTYSPDGKKLAFSSDRDGDYDIYWMRAHGTDAADALSLTNNDTARDDDPSWQPIP